jgi:hypothetical protein
MAREQAAALRHDIKHDLFKHLDKNHDNSISRAEFDVWWMVQVDTSDDIHRDPHQQLLKVG